MKSDTKLQPMDTAPTFEEFNAYAIERIKGDKDNPELYTDFIRAKFDAWDLAGWKKEVKGKLVPIKIWKTTLIQALIYRQPNKVKQIETQRVEVVSTGAYDNVMINTLKYVYNDQRDGKYVKLQHGKGDSVYDFLASKGVIKTKNLSQKEKAYYDKIAHMAQGFVLARVIDDLKTAEGERKEQLERRAKSIKQGLDHDLLPQTKALILTGVFNKYSLEQLLNKIQ